MKIISLIPSKNQKQNDFSIILNVQYSKIEDKKY